MSSEPKPQSRGPESDLTEVGVRPERSDVASSSAAQQRDDTQVKHDEGEATVEASGEAGQDAPAPVKKKRRRRRRGKGSKTAAAPASGEASGGASPAGEVGPAPKIDTKHSDPPSPSPKPRPKNKAMSALTSGLFSHLDAREVPCKVDGCDKTWTWSQEEQIRSFGQPPPKRMCAEHYAQFHALADREINCVMPGCEHTWTWTKSTQIQQLQRTGSTAVPQKTCESCRKAERDLGDTEVLCRVDGCKRTWLWPRDAQLRHRAWQRRRATEEGSSAASAEVESPAESKGDGKGRRKRKRRKNVNHDGPPRRMCEPCKTKFAQLAEREVTCKVHGCTRNVKVDRESQLRAWAALGTDDFDAVAPLPKRMCEVCREFCRMHPDREVACGRPGCANSWTFKTGAQLQAFLAGRLEDPIRLCEGCSKGSFTHDFTENAPPGVEIMPCIVPGCDGSWHYGPTTVVAPSDDGDLPLDRMCDSCRAKRGAMVARRVSADHAGSPSESGSTQSGKSGETTAHGNPDQHPVAGTPGQPTAAATATATDGSVGGSAGAADAMALGGDLVAKDLPAREIGATPSAELAAAEGAAERDPASTAPEAPA